MAIVITTDGLKDNPQPPALPPIQGWAIASGAADVLEASYDPPIIALTDGICVAVRATAANVTTTPTFAPDGLSAMVIRKNAGALAASDIVNNGEYVFRYNLGLTAWTML